MSLTSDPASNVLIDWWLERGAKVDVWTDDEAERCRIGAFLPFMRLGGVSRSVFGSQVVSTRLSPLGERWWFWFWRHFRWREHTVERHPHAFDEPDFALGVSVTPELERVMARGRRLPKKFRATKALAREAVST